jgi:hypothetical protein
MRWITTSQVVRGWVLLTVGSKFIRHYRECILAAGSEYSPDGGYIPRILFLNSGGTVMPEVINKRGSEKHKYCRFILCGSDWCPGNSPLFPTYPPPTPSPWTHTVYYDAEHVAEAMENVAAGHASEAAAEL